VLNSFKNTEFPQLLNVGKRFTAHFVSSAIARVPRKNLPLADTTPEVELGAIYVAGMKEEAQYHLQLSGVAYTQCKDNSNIHDICKKYSANSIPRECIDVSQDYVVVSCSTLGGLDYKNKSNQFNLTSNCQCLTTNGELKLHLNDQDKQLWDLMDNVTFEVMNRLSSSTNSDDLEYWHEPDKTWKNDTPPPEQIRKKHLVHDASTMWIGDSSDTEAPVGLDYHLQGVENVYITGGALWPTGGSWNPVLTIVAMAMHLADII
jgi:choline dehydrogenase-like flavoprotein